MTWPTPAGFVSLADEAVDGVAALPLEITDTIDKIHGAVSALRSAGFSVSIVQQGREADEEYEL